MTDHMAQEIAELHQRPHVSDYAPRRVRQDRAVATRPEPEAETLPPAEQPRAPTLAANAFRVAEQCEELIRSERAARAELADCKARLEQSTKRCDELTAELAISRTQQMAEHEARVRASAILENIGGLVADGLKAN